MIGVFGGTFDPVHLGHLRTALDVQEALGIETIHFVPLKEAVHRDQPGTAAELRCALVQAAIAEQPGFVMDDRELHRPGGSYSVDTLKSFRVQWPDESIAFILGEDAFRGFMGWHKPMEILELAHLVVMQRPGKHNYDNDLEVLSEKHAVESAQQLHDHKAGKIAFQTVTQLDISATDIRRRAATGRSIRYLVPGQVERIIRHLGLYRDAS